MLNSAPILSLAVLPYAWYYVFAGHSQVHFWFTYRLQAITLFTVFAYLIDSLAEGFSLKDTSYMVTKFNLLRRKRREYHAKKT